MKLPARNSIKFKLTVIAASTSALSLLVASAGFPYFDLASYKDKMTSDLVQEADIVGANCGAPLVFGDKKAVVEALQSLKTQNDVRSAGIYSTDGRLYTSYIKDARFAPLQRTPIRGDSATYTGDSIKVYRTVRSDRDVVGYIYLQSDLSGWYARRNKYLLIVGCLLTACIGIALLIGGRLQRIISRPLLDLLNTMHLVTTEKRYDIRAGKRANDEIGQLVDGFNAMLSEIEVRDRTVHLVNDMLEDRVKSRTAQLEQEILERSVAQEELTKSQIVLNDFFENATIGLNLLGPDGVVRRANRAELELLGYEPEEYVGKPVSDFHEDPAPVASMLERLARGEIVAGFESRMRCKNGSLKEVAIEANALWEGDEFVHARCFTRDLTSQREAERARENIERAERANQAKSEFLSRMSHELRTPMNSILGFSQLLELEELTEDQEDSVRQIIGAGKHLLRLINEVLDISRIESGNLSVSNEPVDLVEAITDVVGIVQPLANVRSININSIQSEVAIFALADGQRLRQVLINLLSNAIKYNVEGGTVTVGISRHGQRLRVDVLDTGPGIDEDKANLLFMPFQRLGAEESGIEGTGLGLALSLRLAEAMGGTLGLQKADIGAHFYLDLASALHPLAALEGPGPQPQIAEVAVPPNRKGVNILLVEDNSANVKLIEKILSHNTEIQLRVATRGWQGIEAAKVETPNLVLLDLNLPDMNGLDVLRALRGEQATANVPIIITSADATSGQIERLMNAGANEYLTKPIDVQALCASIDKCLEGVKKKVA